MDLSNQFKIDFITHACEQVLRFSQAEHWEDLSEERKIQLGFNVGVVALGLELTKENSYKPLVDVREGRISIQEFRSHFKSVIESHRVRVDENNIRKPF